MLNPAENTGTIEEIVAYNLIAPQGETLLVCLIPQHLCDCELVGRFVSDGDFKAVGSEAVITAISTNTAVLLAAVQCYDNHAEPTIKEIRVTPKTEFSQLNQGLECNIIVSTVNRQGEKTSRVIAGELDEAKKAFVYPVNEKMTFEKSLYYELLSSISVDVQVVYA